ncbi:hypothetical protein [Lysinibacillus piscis]|uniref:Type II secretion system protein n=1 Tax=Lysinibacillus piscis TaxID=2518931 RepID=A0ABQ5NK92_9BACI|nr:hypothetical protein [Lysinibacillus sp. KH24]GLC88718.1 hypothetical protein LYSBPC_18450 [Lysinibacillus sp. KH24]
MNEGGYSFVETILSVSIIMMLCATLLPVSYTMKTTLYNKRLEVVAAETAYEGLKLYRALQQTEGTTIIDHVTYNWVFDGQEVCVHFQNTRQMRQKCIQLSGEMAK